MNDLYKAQDDLKLSKHTFVCLENLKAALSAYETNHFLAWYNYTLLGKYPNSNNVFDFVLELIKNDVIQDKFFINNNFRLTCLICNKFVNSSISFTALDTYYNSNQEAREIVDKSSNLGFEQELDDIYNYDRYACNKKIYMYLHVNNKVDKQIIAEFISRGLIAFDQKYNNILYVSLGNMDKFLGYETHGIGEKHFMRTTFQNNKIYSFIYCKEPNFSEIDSLVFFVNTLSMFQYLSTHKKDAKTAYCSLHSASLQTYINTLELFPEVLIKEFIFSDKSIIQEFEDYNKKNKQNVAIQTQEEIDNEIPFK